MRDRVVVIAMRHSGTHLIRPMIKRLGFKCVGAKGKNELLLEPIKDRPLVILYRNPRNTLLSWYRWKGGNLDDKMVLASFLQTKQEGFTPVDVMKLWADRWGVRYERRDESDWGVIRVRFEDLTQEKRGLEWVRDFAFITGAPNNPDEAFKSLHRGGTFTGRHSDWVEDFDGDVIKVYRRCGGLELDRLMGYQDNQIHEGE